MLMEGPQPPFTREEIKAIPDFYEMKQEWDEYINSMRP